MLNTKLNANRLNEISRSRIRNTLVSVVLLVYEMHVPIFETSKLVRYV